MISVVIPRSLQGRTPLAVAILLLIKQYELQQEKTYAKNSVFGLGLPVCAFLIFAAEDVATAVTGTVKKIDAGAKTVVSLVSTAERCESICAAKLELRYHRQISLFVQA